MPRLQSSRTCAIGGSSANRRLRIGRFSKNSNSQDPVPCSTWSHSHAALVAVRWQLLRSSSQAPSTLDRQGQAAAGLVSTACEDMLADYLPVRVSINKMFPYARVLSLHLHKCPMRGHHKPWMFTSWF